MWNSFRTIAKQNISPGGIKPQISTFLHLQENSCSENSNTHTDNINCYSAWKAMRDCTGRADSILLFSFTVLNTRATFTVELTHTNDSEWKPVHPNHSKGNSVNIFPSQHGLNFWEPFSRRSTKAMEGIQSFSLGLILFWAEAGSKY